MSHGFSMAFPMQLKAFGKKTDPFELGEAANSTYDRRTINIRSVCLEKAFVQDHFIALR